MFPVKLEGLVGASRLVIRNLAGTPLNGYGIQCASSIPQGFGSIGS